MRILFLLFIIFSFSYCKKENKIQGPLNITLYDKTPKVIYSYLKGKWKFIYGKGGFNAIQMHYCNGCTVEFTPDGRIISNTFFKANAVISWKKEMGAYTNGDSTYIMQFQDDYNVPEFFVIDGIYNDTLVYHDFASDAIFYHFIRF